MLLGAAHHARGWVTECVCIQSWLRRYAADFSRSGFTRSPSHQACLARLRRIGLVWERAGPWFRRIRGEIRPGQDAVSSPKLWMSI
jgi:hypothetical protein